MKARLIEYTMDGNGTEEQYVPHRGVYVENGRYGYLKLKRNEVSKVDCGKAVDVTSVLTDIDTCEKVLILRFIDNNDQMVEIEMDRGDLTDTRILGLTKFGVQVTRNTAIALIQTLENEEAEAEVSYTHSRLGFGRFKNVPIFKGHEAIGINSQYSGELKIQPKGSKEEWLDMVKEHVLGTPMEAIFAIALSAPMIDYLYEDYPVDNILTSLVGTSTTGKTTALMFAVSTGTCPAFSENSLLMSFLDTELSLIHRIPNSYVVGIDESGLMQKNGTRLLYALGNGKERGRMKKDLSMVDTQEFHTAIFFSGEQSILGMSDKTAGLRVRVFELDNVAYTKSADSAEYIKKVCMKNYGWIIPCFSKFLLGHDKEELVKKCSDWSEKFMADRTDDNDDALLGRMAKKVGVILASAELAEEALGVRIDTNYVEEFLLEQLIVDAEEFDIGIKAYRIIIDYYVNNPGLFGAIMPEQSREYPPQPPLPTYYKQGRVESSDPTKLFDGTISKEILYITKQTFDEVLKNASFKDPKVIRERLKELDLLVSPKDRYVVRFKIGLDDTQVKGYKIRIPNTDEPEMERKRIAREEDWDDDIIVFDDEV